MAGILAALANTVPRLAVALYLVAEAVRRWGDPPEAIAHGRDRLRR